MGQFVELCAEALIDRRLAVTSIDSGVPWLTEPQRLANWECRSGVVYSPRLTGTSDLFFQRDGPDDPGYDEWYLFEERPPDMGERLTGNPWTPEFAPRPGLRMGFESRLSFVMHDTTSAPDYFDWFWNQLEWINPESYIADGRDCLTFVSRNEEVFEMVLAQLQADLRAAG